MKRNETPQTLKLIYNPAEQWRRHVSLSNSPHKFNDDYTLSHRLRQTQLGELREILCSHVLIRKFVEGFHILGEAVHLSLQTESPFDTETYLIQICYVNVVCILISPKSILLQRTALNRLIVRVLTRLRNFLLWIPSHIWSNCLPE